MPSRLCLIVESEPTERDFVKNILNREGFQTIETEDGIQALNLVQRLGDALDLIVSEIGMPDGDGVTFVCAVRESFSTLPIILMLKLAESAPTHSTTSFEFLQKPFVPADLQNAIANADKAMRIRKKAGASA